MAEKIRLFDAQSIQLSVMKSNPPQLCVAVVGHATSVGWSEAELVPLEKTLSPDGILDLDFVAKPPDEPVTLPQMTIMAANTVWSDSVERLVGVNVHTRSGEVLQLLATPGVATPEGVAAAAAAAPAQAGFPSVVNPIAQLPTIPIGEGGPTPTTWWRVGEEGPVPKTWWRWGEEGPVPKTWWRPGEEGPLPKTLALGEEGPKTLALGEDGPKPNFGETDPRAEAGTGPFGEDINIPDVGDIDPFGRR